MYQQFLSGLSASYLLFCVGCHCGDLRHKIEAAHLNFFEKVGLDTLHRPDYQEIPQGHQPKDSILVFEFNYDISWTQNAFNGSCEPGYNGTADSIVSIQFFQATNGDTVDIYDHLSGVSELSLVTHRKSSAPGIHFYNHCSLWKNGREAVDDYIFQYNTYDHHSEIQHSCLLNPIRLQLNLKHVRKREALHSFFMVTEFKSKRKLYSNAIELLGNI